MTLQSGVEPLPSTPPYSEGESKSEGEGDASPHCLLSSLTSLSTDGSAISSSPVDRLLRFLRLYRAGLNLPSEAAAQDKQGLFWLTHAQFAEFERRLWADRALWGWFDDKVRWNWEPAPPHSKTAKGKFQVWMQGELHEYWIARCEHALMAAIGALEKKLEGYKNPGDSRAAEELHKVDTGRCPTIEFPSRGAGAVSKPTRTPDATFYHPDQPHFPCLVLEVSHSQRPKNLPRLADDYIVSSRHAIRCVVGLDTKYQAPKSGDKRKGVSPATLFVWRTAIEKDDDGDDVGICQLDVDAACIRSPDGTAPKGVALELTLRDLLPASIIKAVGPQHPDEKLRIPFTDLASYLTAAESRASAARAARAAEAAEPGDELSSRTFSCSHPAKFRHRRSSTPEEVHGETAHRFELMEKAEEERSEREDKEWKPRRRN